MYKNPTCSIAHAKKSMRFLALAVVLLVSFFMGGGTYANAEGTPSEDLGMKTNAYNVDVVVNKDNSFSITETIKVDIITPSRGIIREIPILNQIIRQDDGKTVEYIESVKIDNISVKHGGEPTSSYSDYKESGNQIIRIGDENTYIDGKQKYEITYTMHLPKDKSDEYDSVYLNVIPRGWSTSIEKSKVTMTFPSTVDTSTMEFIGELNGNADTGVAKVTTKEGDNGFVITAKTKRPIAYGEGMTFKLDLPEGYFEQPFFSGWQDAVFYLSVILVPLICILLWFVFGRDKTVIKTVEFYPPEGLTSAQVGYLVDGKLQNKDLTSMYLYWANQGLIKIEETEEKKFVVHKLNEISPKAEYYERKLFMATFKNGNSVGLDLLDEDFGEEFTEAGKHLEEMYTKKNTKLYDTRSVTARKIDIVLSLVPIALYIVFYLYMQIGTEGALMVAAPFLVAYGIFYGVANFIRNILKTKAGIITLVVMVFVFLAACGLTYKYIFADATALFQFSDLVTGDLAAVVLIVKSSATQLLCALAATVIALIFAILTRKKTQYYTDLLGKLYGFKGYIKTAELEKLNMLVKDDPQYFFNILPYAWVFNLTDEWVSRFDTIKIRQPEWYGTYRSDSVFELMLFANTIRMFNRNIQRHADTYQATSQAIGSGGTGGHGGGFSGGGGVSGGGFGGGGGGRW